MNTGKLNKLAFLSFRWRRLPHRLRDLLPFVAQWTPTPPQREDELRGTKKMPRKPKKQKPPTPPPPEEPEEEQEPKASRRKRRKRGDRAPVKAPPEEPRHNIRTSLPWRPDTAGSAGSKFLGYYVQQAHDVNPGGELDFDWTIAPGNKSKEFALRLHTRIRLS